MPGFAKACVDLPVITTAEAIDRVAQVRTGHQGRLIASYVTFGRYDMIWISE
jgi:uncharacterized protein with GYD domain